MKSRRSFWLDMRFSCFGTGYRLYFGSTRVVVLAGSFTGAAFKASNSTQYFNVVEHTRILVDWHNSVYSGCNYSER
jgi:hypothetical protein